MFRIPGSQVPNHLRSYFKPATVPAKSLMGIPWRYAIRCIDDLGLILRAEVIWSKPNGLPESVTDRVRRSHEQWFHFTKEPRYFSAVDEIRERYDAPNARRTLGKKDPGRGDHGNPTKRMDAAQTMNPLGKLPGSVWTIPTQPLRVPSTSASTTSQRSRWSGRDASSKGGRRVGSAQSAARVGG